MEQKSTKQKFCNFTAHSGIFRFVSSSRGRVSDRGDLCRTWSGTIYDTYREAGGNFIDTANFYTGGASERFVGEFIASHRAEVVLATKYSNAVPGRDANAGGNQRKNMVQAVEASLKRLGTDYIDVYWLHAWDQVTPPE